MSQPALTHNPAGLLAPFRGFPRREQVHFLAMLLRAGVLPRWRIVRR
jgi:hypothetical protein